MDPGIMNVYDNTLDFLDKLGVQLDKKSLKRRALSNLLDDTNKLNNMVSSEVVTRFKKQLCLRKERLAFRMDKVFCVKNLQRDVYDTLALSVKNQKASITKNLA